MTLDHLEKPSGTFQYQKHYFAEPVVKLGRSKSQYGLAWASLVHSHAPGDGVGVEQVVEIRLHLQP